MRGFGSQTAVGHAVHNGSAGDALAVQFSHCEGVAFGEQRHQHMARTNLLCSAVLRMRRSAFEYPDARELLTVVVHAEGSYRLLKMLLQ